MDQFLCPKHHCQVSDFLLSCAKVEFPASYVFSLPVLPAMLPPKAHKSRLNVPNPIPCEHFNEKRHCWRVKALVFDLL